jgi:hypothetical protein
MDEDNDIRAPDKTFADKLIPDINFIPDFLNEVAEKKEVKKVRKVVKKEKRGKREKKEEEKVEDTEDDISLAIAMSKNDYLERVEKEAIENSLHEYYEKMIAEEEVRVEAEKKNRQIILETFIKRVEKLAFTKEDIYLKKLLIPILENYISCKNDSTVVPPGDYIMIRKYMDELYTSPLEKGRKTAISKEEYELIGKIIYQ